MALALPVSSDDPCYIPEHWQSQCHPRTTAHVEFEPYTSEDGTRPKARALINSKEFYYLAQWTGYNLPSFCAAVALGGLAIPAWLVADPRHGLEVAK